MAEARGLLAVIWAAAALAAGLAGAGGARLVGEAGALRAEAALGPSGFAWARAEADGLRVTLRGEAPDEVAMEAAMAALEAAARPLVPGFAPRILNAATARAAPPVWRPQAEASILRGLSDITVAGAAPGRAAQAALREALEAAAPGLSLVDLSRDDAEGPAERWLEGSGEAAEIAAALLHGRVSLSEGRITFAGVAAGPEEVARIEAAMARAEAAGLLVEADLAALPVAAAPHLLHAETGPGLRLLIACAAETEEAAAALAARFGPPGGAPREAECAVRAGAPPGWGDAAAAGLDALLSLPAGEFRMEGRRARLSTRPPTRRLALDAAAAKLRAAMPEGYRLAVLSGGGGEVAPAEEEARPDAPAATVPPLLIERRGGLLRLSGAAPDPLIGEALAAYARAAVSGVSVELSLTYGGGSDRGWREAAMALIAGLARLEEGRARLDEAAAWLEGEVDDPRAIREIHAALVAALGGERAAETRLTVSPARLAAREKLPPGRCAERLTEIAAADPIRFAPGSAEIEGVDPASIRALSEALSRCAGGRIEIGGHTDSQGPEAANLALSAARAQAVLAALLEAGARLTALTAKGYGEAEPIADNGTEEGRALNRRIGFRALAEPPE